ncbi:MAG: 3-dehydroquinate synthase [Bacteroidales bacterium]|nr:3-dehydroquinate synthase [Bacteroidales bacterium]
MNEPLFWDDGASAKLLELISTHHYLVLCDTNTRRHCLPLLQKLCGRIDDKQIICIPAGEENKNMETLHFVWNALFENRMLRNSLLLCVGGGMVCDLGGFAAATWKRGIPFVFIPTSLMAQADAAIGGKTAVNFNGVKNQIGLFQRPEAVCMFHDFLHTLPVRELRSGFAEMLKHGLIANSNYWNSLCHLSKFTDILQHPEWIRKSAIIKSSFTTLDFKEQGDRQLLNFGHTFGHALEAAEEGGLSHGEAVAHGMALAAELSSHKQTLTAEACHEITESIRHFYGENPIRRHAKKIIELMLHDKKRVQNNFNFILLQQIGKAVGPIPVSAEEVKEMLG